MSKSKKATVTITHLVYSTFCRCESEVLEFLPGGILLYCTAMLHLVPMLLSESWLLFIPSRFFSMLNSIRVVCNHISCLPWQFLFTPPHYSWYITNSIFILCNSLCTDILPSIYHPALPHLQIIVLFTPSFPFSSTWYGWRPIKKSHHRL